MHTTQPWLCAPPPSSQSCQSIQLRRPPSVKSSPSTCQLIDGVEVASLDQRCSGPPPTHPPPSQLDDPASVFKQSTHGHMLFFFFFSSSASPSILGAYGESLNTYISSASLTQPAGSAPLSLLPVMIVNKSFTVVKGNRRVSERQITPTGRH